MVIDAWGLVIRTWYLAPTPRLCLAKYLSLFAGNYRQKDLHLHSRLHRHLYRAFHLNLNLNLDLGLYPPLYRELLAKPYRSLFRQLSASSFVSWFEGLTLGSCLLTSAFSYG